MIMLTESERVDKLTAGEAPPPVWVRVVGQGGDPVVTLERVKEVMRLVVQEREEGWPGDDWWRSNLPPWFLQSFEGHTEEELLRDDSLWDFGSWLDAMKDPGWTWWSSLVREDTWHANLSAHTDPFSVGPLEYLARAAGAESVSVRE